MLVKERSGENPTKAIFGFDAYRVQRYEKVKYFGVWKSN